MASERKYKNWATRRDSTPTPAEVRTIIRSFTKGTKPDSICRYLGLAAHRVNKVLADAGLIPPIAEPPPPDFYTAALRAGDTFIVRKGAYHVGKAFIWGFQGKSIELRSYARLFSESDEPVVVVLDELSFRQTCRPVEQNDDPRATLVCGPWKGPVQPEQH